MKARLHNYFEFVTRGEKKAFYNTLLPGLNQRFLNGEKFCAKIAFGMGNGGAQTASLVRPLGEKSCEIYDCNFDAAKGPLFVKKYIELAPGEFDGQAITEAGFVSSAGGLVNYVEVPGGIIKPEGESLLIIGTLLLELSADVQGEICGEDNPLFKLLLGEASHLFERFFLEAGKEAVPMQKRVEQGKLAIEAALPEECDFRTAAISSAGRQCVVFDAARFQNTFVNESVPVNFVGGGAAVGGEGLESVGAVLKGGIPVPFSSKPVPSGAGGCLKNPFQVTVRQGEEVAFSPSGRFMSVFGKDILSVYEADGGLKPLRFSFLSFAYSDLIMALPDDDGNLYALTDKPPYVRVMKNDGGTLWPCSQAAEFPSGITEMGLSRHGGRVYIKCSTGRGSAKEHYTFLTNISGTYYTHEQTFYAQGYLRRFYSSTDDGEVVLDLKTSRASGNRQVSEKAIKLLAGCDKAVLCGKLIYIMADGRWRLYTLEGDEVPLYDSGIRKLFISGSGNIIKVYANNSLSGCYADGETGRVYPYPIDVKLEGEVIDAAASDYGLVVISSSKNIENRFIPLRRERAALCSEGLNGQAQAQVARRSFKNFSSKKVSLMLSIEEVQDVF